MAYYVTIRNSAGDKTIWAAGPFNRHGDAENCVGWVRRYVEDAYKNARDLAWAGFGTAHVKSGRMPKGKFNEAIGLPAEGRITELPLQGNRWWTAGQNEPLPIKAPQRRPRVRSAA